MISAHADAPTARLSKNAIESFQKHLHFTPDGPNQIGHFIIEDHSNSINQATWLYIKEGLDYYKKTKPLFIILELNTPGGEVFAAQKISDALKEFDTQFNIPILCFINNWAISAGAMLAYSCRFIVTTKDASMGAAEPIIIGENQQITTASEKVNSALRADFAGRARFFDRNPLIAEAMVDKDMILVVRNGEVIRLDNETQIRTGEPDPDDVLSPKGKLLTLSAAEMLKFGVSEALLLPQKTGFLTDEEISSGQWPAHKMLLFHAPFFDEIPHATIDSYRMDWKSRLFAFLALPWVSSLLLFGLILGIYVELSTPGFGLPGAIGVICLILIMLSSFALEIANWLEVILLLLGLAILFIDFFLLPTFGLLGFAGLIFFFGGLFGMLLPGLNHVGYEPGTNTLNAAAELVLERLTWLAATLIGAAVLIGLLARYLMPKFAAYSKLVLKGNEQDADQGYVASTYDKGMIGKKGIVLTDLKPGGYILIEGNKLQALSIEGYIAQGNSVDVIGGQEESLLVKPTNKEQP